MTIHTFELSRVLFYLSDNVHVRCKNGQALRSTIISEEKIQQKELCCVYDFKYIHKTRKNKTSTFRLSLFLGHKTNITFTLVQFRRGENVLALSVATVVFCLSDLIKKVPSRTPGTALLCRLKLTVHISKSTETAVVIQEQVRGQTASRFDILPVFCYQDIPVSSNQVHWKNKSRSREKKLTCCQPFWIQVDSLCLVSVSAQLMILLWNICSGVQAERFLGGETGPGWAWGFERKRKLTEK